MSAPNFCLACVVDRVCTPTLITPQTPYTATQVPRTHPLELSLFDVPLNFYFI
jgi:hypothetical protein